MFPPLLVLSVIFVLSASSQDIRYVRPNTSSSHLHHIGHVTLRGEDNDSTINIICQNRITIQCNNVTNLKIEGLTFLFNTNQHRGESVLHISYSTKVVITNSKFIGSEDTSAQALHVSYTNITVIRCLFDSNIASYGGAILIIHGNMIIEGNNFVRNEAYYSGGAIQARSGTTIIMNGTSNIFSLNTATVYGGAIDCHLCAMNMMGDTVLKDNFMIRKTNGGGISVASGNVTITGSVNFENNTSSDNGGGFYLVHSYVTITGSVNFENNTSSNGGGIYLANSNITVTGSVNFENNTSNYGGGIHLLNSYAMFSSEAIVTFHGNVVDGNGGGIHSETSSILTNTDHMIFTGNSASGFGGAIHINGYTVLALTSNQTIISGTFLSNRASAGGALSIQYNYNTTLRNVRISGNSAIFTISSLVIFKGENNFSGIYKLIETSESNRMIVSKNSFLYFEGRNYFVNNSGGAIETNKTQISFHGRTIFANNEDDSVDSSGGAIKINQGKLTFNGVTRFSNNRAHNGGAIKLKGGVLLFNSLTTFTHNTAQNQGGAIHTDSGMISFTRNVHFINNTSTNGGAINSWSANISFNGTTAIFSGNSAEDIGGAISSLYGKISFYNSTTFTNNRARSGGAIYTQYHTLSFNGHTDISDNTAIESGGAVDILYGNMSFNDGPIIFTGNTARTGGAINSKYSTLSFGATSRLSNNVALKDGGALYLLDTTVSLKITISLSFNLAQNGGAMYLLGESYIKSLFSSNIYTLNNKASHYGGGIYHKDYVTPVQCNYVNRNQFSELPNCFLRLSECCYEENNTAVTSFKDSAGKDGNFLYGGLLDKCRLYHNNIQSYNMPYSYKDRIRIMTENNTKNNIASEPFKLCFCTGELKYNCSSTSKNVERHRGLTLNVPIIALGQGNIVTSALVTTIVNSSARLELNQSSQTLPNHCTSLKFNLYSTKDSEELILYPDGPCRDTGLARVVINVTLLPCPDAFVQYGEECICEERLQAYNATCTIGDDITITRNAGSKFWMSALYNDSDGSYVGLILYQSCPPEYCKTESVVLSLNSLDDQCDLNRTGVLCGACASNHSLMLGSSRCAICSNRYLSLLLPFALAGILLVFFLIFTRITVATGMINSIILYANFVQVNRKLFFPINERNVLTVFIAWLNLDLGFETCFFHGMDAYTQTCLQFAFPIYVWILIVLIILTSRYSITVSKLIGSNPIAVLATLLLMSYNKILKIILKFILSYT